MEIIQTVQKNNLTLRQRDLKFVNSLYETHQASVSQQDAEVKRQKVLEDIKRECLTHVLRKTD